MILAKVLLLAVCVSPSASVVISSMYQSPSIAIIPAPVACDPTLAAAASLVQKAIENLPAWEDDVLARFEQPELAAVKADIQECIEASPKTNAEFLKAVDKLKLDAGVLEALDTVLMRQRFA